MEPEIFIYDDDSTEVKNRKILAAAQRQQQVVNDFYRSGPAILREIRELVRAVEKLTWVTAEVSNMQHKSFGKREIEVEKPE